VRKPKISGIWFHVNHYQREGENMPVLVSVTVWRGYEQTVYDNPSPRNVKRWQDAQIRLMGMNEDLV